MQLVRGKYCIISLLIFVIAMLGGCQRQERQVSQDQVKFVIGVSQANLIEPWRIIMNEEIREEAAKHSDVRIVFTDAVQNSEKQVRDVGELLQQGIDLLIISPNDSVALTPVVAQAYKKIPVIVLDRAVEGYDYTLYIGPDNKSIGREAGKYISELLNKTGGNVVEIQGPSGVPSLQERSAGFREVIGKYANISIIDTIVADWQRDKAEDKMTELLDQYPKIDVVFAHSDYMALGAYKAAKKKGLTGIKFVGIDGFSGPNGGLQLVEDGVLQGTFTCLTGGREAIQYALDILNHEKGLPKKIIPRSNKITLANVLEYVKSTNEVKKNNPTSNRRIVLGFSQLGAESDWRRANSQSIKTAAREADIELIFLEGDQRQETQIRDIRSFIAQGVDVIAFSPVIESGWTEVLEEAKAAGIPVVLSDRAIKSNDASLYASFIGSDFVEEGRRAARWLVGQKKDTQQQNIVEIEGTFDSAPALDRKKGFAEIISNYPENRVIYSASGDFTEAGGQEIMKSALALYGNKIDVVYAHNDDMALGAIKAIEEYGLRPGKDILIVSVDATEAAFKAMLAGKLNCTVECTPLLGPQLMQAVKTLMMGRQLPMRIITSEGVFPAETARKDHVNRKY
ncbi:substrate-binding domain-containing protein [Pelosinus sp. UFO1]|uniref:substrate-binding domain-containing protein n=1 Tax=Pelosinus sp. UFO1 TaxID=484770 RepID=UPI0011871808|nr:substrate-binding domain-containing protein [Pelosinus sp. UFO1]